MEQVRCFVAIELPEGVKAGLSRLQARLKAQDPPEVKWVEPTGVHLTLKFLGEVDADMTSLITESVREAARGIPPFRLEVVGLGVFPNLRRVQVVWVGLGGELGRLLALQKRVECGLAGLGFAPEARAFPHHLTLARVRERAAPGEREEVGRVVASAKFDAALDFPVSEVSLMRSQLSRAGAVYSQISSVRLE